VTLPRLCLFVASRRQSVAPPEMFGAEITRALAVSLGKMRRLRVAEEPDFILTSA